MRDCTEIVAAPSEAISEDATDADLVKATLAGKSEAFGILVERHYRLVYAVAFSRVQDADSAEDIAQEAFIRAHGNLARLETRRYFSTWLVKITRNLAADSSRKRQAHRARVIPLSEVINHTSAVFAPDGIERINEAQERGYLNESLRSLDPTVREIILLHYGEGWSLTEIAARLGTHRSTVSRMHAAALESLRSDLEPILRGTCSQLLGSSRAATRVALCLAAIAALPSVSQASAVSSSAASSAGAAVAGSGAAGSSVSIATSMGGALVMKKTVIGAVAIALIAGSGYYIHRQANPDLFPKAKQEPVVTNAGGAGTGLPPYYLSVADSSEKRGSMSMRNRTALETTGTTAGSLLGLQSGFEPEMIVFEGYDDDTVRKDITLRAAEEYRDQFKSIVMHVAQEAYNVTLTPEKRTTDVFVLKRNGARPGMPAWSTFNHEGERKLSQVTPKQLCRTLFYMFQKPVIDEAALPETVNARLHWTLKDYYVAIEEPSGPLELTIEPARRSLEYLVVRPK